jgi:hypothetical protein
LRRTLLYRLACKASRGAFNHSATCPYQRAGI